MARLKLNKLHTRFRSGVTPTDPIIPRRYTLTHSDRTGHLYLTIGPDYDKHQISGYYSRLMRDEVLAEWEGQGEDPAVLHVYCHVSGGFVLGSARRRNRILLKEMPLALEAIRTGDEFFFRAHPELDETSVLVHFQSNVEKYNRVEDYGPLKNYRVAPK